MRSEFLVRFHFAFSKNGILRIGLGSLFYYIFKGVYTTAVGPSAASVHGLVHIGTFLLLRCE
jgi:hypothetical protein